MNSLLSHLDAPWVQWIVGLAIVFFVYKAAAGRLRGAAPDLSLDRLLGMLLGPSYARGRVTREARRLAEQGHHLAAGRLFEDNARLPEAVEAYLAGNELVAAASVLEKARKYDRAAELYVQAGDYKRGADVLVAAGRPARAAELLETKGNNLDAARLYAEAGASLKAAELYLKAGFALRAAEAFEQAGESARAAECFERHFVENVSYGSAYATSSASPDQKCALRAGELYEKAGDLAAAARILSRGSYFGEAAEVALKRGEFVQAAEWFLRAENLLAAADAYARAGDTTKSANYRGEAAYKAGEIERAAELFQEARDYLRAAELFEQIEAFERAAGAYEAGENFAAAGGVYLRSGHKARAAAAYERAGDHETAARLFEEVGQADKSTALFDRAGLTFKSGMAAADAGDTERAIGLLQRVEASDEHYGEASERLAELLIDAGRALVAVERLRATLSSRPAGAADLGLRYWLSRGLEAAGQPSEAAAGYRKILAHDMHFRDAEARLRRLDAAPASPPPPSAPAAAAASWPPVGTAPVAPAPGRFTDQHELGRGPLGVVYRARDTRHDRLVALRALPAGIAGDTYRALVDDLKAAAAVTHPNLARILGVFEASGQRYVVSELVEGRSCAGPLQAGRRMPVGQAVGLARVLAQALAAVHSAGLVHGSVLPSNVVLAGSGFKLTDLGLARLVREAALASPYRPPESELAAGVEADLFGVVALVYHLVTGRSPERLPVALPGTLLRGAPDELDQLCFRGLHPEPEVRFAAASELLTALGRVSGA